MFRVILSVVPFIRAEAQGPRCLSLFLHMNIFKNKQLAGCLQAHTHYHIHTHSPSCRHVGESERAQTHRPTTIHTAKCTHTNTHIDTPPYGTNTLSHCKHYTSHSSFSLCDDIHNFLKIIFLWSLLALSISEHNNMDTQVENDIPCEFFF